jgi:hypothetical protein
MKLTREQLSEWRRLTEGASAGPWKWDAQSAYVTCHDDEYVNHDGPLARVESCRREDNAFIATSREAMPQLLDAAEELLAMDAHFRASEKLRQSYMQREARLGVIINRYRGLLEAVHTDPAECDNYYDGCHCMAVRAGEALELLKMWIVYSSTADFASPDDWDDLIERTLALVGDQQ